MLKKMCGIFIIVLILSGCFQDKTENALPPIEALKAHLMKNYSSLKISPMAEAFAGLAEDPAQREEIIKNAKAGYTEMKIQEIYLLTGPTAESNESVIGSLIHFNDSLTLEEAKAELAKDSNFKEQALDIYMNKNFAFVIATINGKKVTPQAVIDAFKKF